MEARGLFGSYARALGWSDGRMGGTAGDATMHLRTTLDVKRKPGG